MREDERRKVLAEEGGGAVQGMRIGERKVGTCVRERWRERRGRGSGKENTGKSERNSR